MQEQEIKRINAYSLLDFAVELEKSILEGYRVSLDNENYPVSFGTHFTAGLVKQDVVVNTTTTTNTTESTEVDTEVKRVRKPKVS